MNQFFKSKVNHLLSVSLIIFLMFSCSKTTESANPDFYQIKIYKLSSDEQVSGMDKYLKEAYIPALHRAGISKVGVFKPVEGDTVAGKVIVVWIPFKSLKQMDDLPMILDKDAKYLTEGADYIDAAYNNTPYSRIETILLKAFRDMPQFEVPDHNTPVSERIYELRSYQGPTEKIFRKKVEMFNEGGEMKIFKELNFKAVFYAEVISGSTMPNLMYMTTHANKQSREENWNAFRAHPDWKTLSAMEKYKNTVSKITIWLMHPADYSEI